MFFFQIIYVLESHCTVNEFESLCLYSLGALDSRPVNYDMRVVLIDYKKYIPHAGVRYLLGGSHLTTTVFYRGVLPQRHKSHSWMWHSFIQNLCLYPIIRTSRKCSQL